MKIYDLKPEWLTYLALTAQMGSYSLAAEKLYLREPVLRYNLKALEAHFQTPLLERTERGLILTSSGKQLLQNSHSFLEKLQFLQGQLTQLKPQAQSLAVGVSFSYPETRLSLVLAQIDQLFPEIQFRLMIGQISEIKEWLRSDQIELALVTSETWDDPDFTYTNGTYSPGIYVKHPTKEVPPIYFLPALPNYLERSGKKTDLLDFSDLKKYAGIFKEKMSFRYIGTFPLTLKLALSGAGMGFVPEIYAAPYLAQEQLKRTYGPHLDCGLTPSLVHFHNRILSAPAQAFKELILEHN
ncbi:MAG: LysR family transcriptional regulator [Candidatus Sericytochromatia bacterium]|nr:LysR family transcriptional regulator [Candidatus Sericytochromatia bacterium]